MTWGSGQSGRLGGVGKVYTKEVHTNLAPLYANWDPQKVARLGDFGTMVDDSFNYMANVEKYGLKLGTRPSTGDNHRQFMSQGGGSFEVYAKGQARLSGVVALSAGVDIQFTKQDAVFFNAGGCIYDMVDDKVALGQSIIDLLHKKQWQKDWVVLTDRIQAGATTIALSDSSSASITLEASADVPKIDLASGNLRLTASRNNSVGYTIVTQSGLVPLIGFCKIETHIFGRDTLVNALTAKRVHAVEGFAAGLDASPEQVVETLHRAGKRETHEVLTFERLE